MVLSYSLVTIVAAGLVITESLLGCFLAFEFGMIAAGDIGRLSTSDWSHVDDYFSCLIIGGFRRL